MSFNISSYTPGRDDITSVDSHPFMRERLPFPTEAWRSMLTPLPAGTTSATPAAGRSRHPAEIALEEVEQRFQRAVISINDAMNAELPPRSTDDDWHPRAA